MLRGVLPIWPEKRGNVSPLWDWSICSLWEPNLANQHTQCYMTADAARLEWETTWLSDWAGADLLNVQWQTHPFIYVHVLYRHIHIQTHIYSSAYVDMATFLSLSLSPQTHQYINTFFLLPPAGGSIWRAGSSQRRGRYQCQLHRYTQPWTLLQWCEFGIGLPALPDEQWDRSHPDRSAIQWVQ